METSSVQSGLFAGLKVLDVGTWIAGPVAATILADYGADVIKVEMPEVGDQYRMLSGLPTYPDAPDNYMWQMDARNKRSLSLNLKTDAGIKVLHQLIADCDVYITNQPFPVRDAFSLNYEDLKPLNPRMIYASLSAYGEQGPERDREGFDLVAYWARTGLMDLVRDPQGTPSQALPGMGDHPSAVTLYASIVTALLQREKTGEGSLVHTSLLANGLWSASCIAQAAFSGGDYESYRGFRQQPRFPTAVYRTLDDRILQFTMVRTPEQIAALLACLGLAELLDDARFATPETRMEHASEFSVLLQQSLIEADHEHWLSVFKENAVPAVMVATIEEVQHDVQIHANDMLMPHGEGVKLVRHPLNVGGLQRSPVTDAPELGEHSHEILKELGYSSADIAALHKAGVI